MKVALLGFDFVCPNKGCEALSYSFVSTLVKLFPNEEITIHNISYKETLGEFPQRYPNVKFINHKIFLKNPKYLYIIYKLLKKCDAVFDITYGDSFSDIYGVKWNVQTNINKQIAELSKSKLILLPQTYGPYKNKIIKNWALSLIHNSEYCFSRDEKSKEYLSTNGIDGVEVVTDLAMALPYDKSTFEISQEKINVGINVSSLLWENGFTGKNEFGLTVDYKSYITELINILLKSAKYRIHLIPHVIDNQLNAPEDDWRPIKIIHSMYPETIMTPDIENPMDIKSYIANMDVFIGARMHSTIAAFSSLVPVIPFSYSRKFEGLYDNLNYPYVINGRGMDTDKALKETIQYIENRDNLFDSEKEAMKEVEKFLLKFESKIVDIINK